MITILILYIYIYTQFLEWGESESLGTAATNGNIVPVYR
jgi:hypothetical protein